jgi:uncharacterized repeat protein (TIGR01451 family)
MLIACALLLVVAGESSFAAGTRAGTQITSNASATYTDQTGSGPTYNASATALSIYVAYKPVSTITVVTSPQTGVDSSYVVYQLTIANTGNYGDAYAVEFNSASTQLDSIGWYSNAGLTAALGGAAKNILRDTIPTDGNVTVYAKLHIKYDATFNSYDNTTIVGTFRSRSTRDETVDSAITIPGPITIPIGAGLANSLFNAAGSTTTTIVQSVFDVTATPTRSTVRPGDTLSYLVKYNNTGHSANSGVKVYVTYPTGMTYSAQSSANWADHGSYAIYSVGAVSATSGQLTISDPLILDVNNSASFVEATATAQGSFGIIYIQTATNGLTQVRITTSTFSTANYAFKAFGTTRTAALADTSISAQPGDSITVKYIIKNNSNGSDAYVISFSAASEGSWSFSYNYETNNDGSYSGSNDLQFNNATYSASQYLTTPTIARGADTTIYIRTKVPSGLATSPIQLVLKIRSARDSATVNGEYVGGRVTPLLPIIVVERARVINGADSVGTGANVSVVPGGTVTYYIYVRNTGNGAASTVVITDNVSATGNYVNPPTSATINDGSDHTFAIPGGNAGTFGSIATSGSGVVITINTLAAGASRVIYYATTVQ